jgi:putative heme iron utilization protein
MAALAAALGAATGAVESARAEDAFCATPQQKAIISKFYASQPGAPPPMAERTLSIPEQVVVTALPPERAAMTQGEQFAAVWKSLEQWRGSPTFIVTRNGSVLKFPSSVPQHRPHTRDDGLFDFKPTAPGSGLEGHLRPELIRGIGAINLPGRGDATRAVLFFDAAGQSVFGVYATLVGESQAPQLIADFDLTWALIASLPTFCDRVP